MSWSQAAIAEVVDARSGFASGESVEDGVAQVRMNNVTPEGRFDWTRLRRVPLPRKGVEGLLAEPGDVLFNATNSPELVGKSACFLGFSEPLTYSNHFLRLRPRSHLDGRYLAYWLASRWKARVFEGMCRSWVNQASVSKEQLLALTIPLPPVDEQRRIATILDQADALRHKRLQALSQISALKAVIFESMFGGDNNLGPNVQVNALSEVVRAGTIVTYGMVQAGEEFEGGIPYIRTGDIIDGEIAVQQLRRADPAIAARFDRARVDAGDIVMSIRATVGTTATVPRELAGANLTQGTAKIAPGELTDPTYLLEYLRSKRAQDWIAKQVKGATFREITLGRLREMPVEVPNMDLQKKFSGRIAKLVASRCAQREQARQFDTLFASLQHRAFIGEL